MTTSDPFAPVDRLPDPGDPVVTEPVNESPTGSIDDVLKWVDEDPEKARVALDAEESGNKRKTLIAKLKELVE